MELHMGEKTSMLQQVFEKDDQYGQQDVDDTHDFRKSYTMDSKNVACKAHAAHWTHEEDEKLRQHIVQHGKRGWSYIARELPDRSGKQCRERWINNLDTGIKKGRWTQTEEAKLVKWHKELGKKWAQIAKHIDGRPENTIKNHWYATARSVEAKHRNKKEDTSSAGILENYIRSLLEEKDTQQGLNGGGEKFVLADIYDKFLFSDQENGYLPSPYAPAPENHYSGYAGAQLGGGYFIQPQQQQLPQHPVSAQQEQAFINYNYSMAEEDPIGQVFAGRFYHNTGRDQGLQALCYYHHASGPSHYDNNGGGNHTGFYYEAAANNGLAMPPARANEGPSSLNPPAPGPGGYF